MTALCTVLNKNFDIFRCQLDQAWDGLPVYALSSIPVINSLFLEYKARQALQLLNLPSPLTQMLNVQKIRDYIHIAGFGFQVEGYLLVAIVALNFFVASQLGWILLAGFALTTLHLCVRYWQVHELYSKVEYEKPQPQKITSEQLALLAKRGESLRISLHKLVVKYDNRTNIPPDWLKCLVENPLLLNERDEKGMTPLHHANTLEMIRLLVSNGASVDAIDNEGNTILHTQKKLAEEAIDYLVSKGINVNCQNTAKETPLHKSPPPSTENFLFWRNMVESLLAHGANPDILDDKGTSARAKILEMFPNKTPSSTFPRITALVSHS